MQWQQVNWWNGYRTLLSSRPPRYPKQVDELIQWIRQNVKGNYYNPIPFMEFRDIPPLRHYPHERLQACLDRATFQDSIVVDVGASMGYYSFLAAEAGAKNVFTIETYDKAIEVINRVAYLYGLEDHVATRFGNVQDYPFDEVQPDIVMAFSVLPYLGQKSRAPLEEVLKRMAQYCGICFIEMGDGGSALDWASTDEDFEMLFRDCGFSRVEAIGSMSSTHSGTKRTLWECRGIAAH